jgi:ribosomal protein S27AE
MTSRCYPEWRCRQRSCPRCGPELLRENELRRLRQLSDKQPAMIRRPLPSYCYPEWRCLRRNCPRCGPELLREAHRKLQLEAFFRAFPPHIPRAPDDPKLN